MGITRSENMRRIRSKDTKPEMIVRRLVYGLGYRYRLHYAGIAGKPDLVFIGKKKVIFIHGCFWHQHSFCREGRIPNSNREYWVPKLLKNVQRDKDIQEKLITSGWEVLLIWECELEDLESLKIKIQEFLG